MKFSYSFSNLFGAVYKKGNLSFTKDGNSVVSPVGNRIRVFDLKNNKTNTLPVESSMNITAVGLSPDGSLLIAVNEEGSAMLVSMYKRCVINYYHFHKPVNNICFSPDGKKFAVTRENDVLIFHAPGRTKEFNPFVLYRSFYGAYDETVSLDWTSDSSAFCAGCRDMNTRVYGAKKYTNLIVYSLGGHTDSIVNSFFEHDSLDLYSLSGNGQLCVWECDTELDGLLVPGQETDSDDSSNDEEDSVEEGGHKKQSKNDSKKNKIVYKRHAKYNYKDCRGEGASPAHVTAAAFHKKSHILCTGFSDGSFFLHEMPEFNMIHSLSISDQNIAAVSFNSTGDWIALGCSGLGQLLVWEWQSETYVLKQQGHFNNMECLAYSPDGLHVATGGEDSKVKVWNTSTGFCFVTFSEHSGAVTAVKFSQNGQVIVSSSLDGTVRAFDLNRYRNFRTFTSPRPAQFACLALDPSGEIICAGSRDTFEIFVWSMQTGRLLDMLAGHEGPISSLSFSTSRPILASGSWDKTVRIWDVFESRGSKETITASADVLDVTFSPDGNDIAVATLDAAITFWEVETCSQISCIEGRRDMGYTRKELDKITAKKSSHAKSFNTLCYSADGQCIIAAGRSNMICIYSIKDKMLLRKFPITCNTSLDGTQEFLDRRKMTEWGSMALIDDKDDGNSIPLPGARRGDMSSRHHKPEVRVSGVHFSPTGREWAATTTEGLVLYSLDQELVFDPYDLAVDVNPETVRRAVQQADYNQALILAFRLNEQALVAEVVEQIPHYLIESLALRLPDVYVDKMLHFVAGQLETSAHIQFYMTWAHSLLYEHGPRLKLRSANIGTLLRDLQRSMTQRSQDLCKLCDGNKYSMEYIISLAQTRKKRKANCHSDEFQEEIKSIAKLDSEQDDSNDDDDIIMQDFV